MYPQWTVRARRVKFCVETDCEWIHCAQNICICWQVQAWHRLFNVIRVCPWQNNVQIRNNEYCHQFIVPASRRIKLKHLKGSARYKSFWELLVFCAFAPLSYSCHQFFFAYVLVTFMLFSSGFIFLSIIHYNIPCVIYRCSYVLCLRACVWLLRAPSCLP